MWCLYENKNLNVKIWKELQDKKVKDNEFSTSEKISRQNEQKRIYANVHIAEKNNLIVDIYCKGLTILKC